MLIDGKLYKWGPFDGKTLFIDIIMNNLINFKNEFGIAWPKTTCHIKDNHVLVFFDHEAMYESGVEVFEKYPDMKDQYDKYLEVINKINKLDLNSNLKPLVKKFLELFDKFWTIGLLPELANFGAEKKLREIIETKYADNAVEILEALSSPNKFSFYQEEEIDLMNTNDLKKHQKKYFWIETSYGGVKTSNIDYFKKRKENLNLEKIEQLKDYSKKVDAKKQEIISKFKLSDEIKNLSSQLCFTIWWQDDRKGHIFQFLHKLDYICERLSLESKIPKDNYLWLNENELYNLEIPDLTSRKKDYLSFYDPNKNSISYYYNNSKIYKELYVDDEINTSEVSGLVTSKGVVVGTAKIVIGSKDFHKLKKGDILVTPMTAPDYITIMRKSAAIVTDHGGITCHAAIVSRELKIPCIVGTGSATKAFKDGDKIKVDANTGVIRKID